MKRLKVSFSIYENEKERIDQVINLLLSLKDRENKRNSELLELAINLLSDIKYNVTE